MNGTTTEMLHYSSVIAAELMAAAVLAIIMFAMLSYKEHRKSSYYLFLSIAVEFLFLLGDAASFYNLSISALPVWLMYITYFISYTFGFLVLIPFSLYSGVFIMEKTIVKRGVYQVPILLSLISVVVVVVSIISGSVYGVVDGKMTELNGLPAIASLIQIFVALYLPVVAFTKKKQIGLKGVMLLGVFGLLPITIYFISYNFAGVATAISLVIVYVLLQSDTSANKEKQRKELEELNNTLEEQQAQLEESAAEQEAQLEEVSALNVELEENRSQLEKQLAVIGATSQRYYCAYSFDLKKNLFYEVFSLPSLHAAIGSEGDATKPLELAWRNFVIPEDQDIMREFHDITRWKEYLQDRDRYSVEYRGVTRGWSRATLYAAKRENGVVTNVIYTLEEIHDQKKTELTLASQLQEITALNADISAQKDAMERQLDIIGSMAAMYASIYYIDMTTLNFVELGKSSELVTNAIGTKGNAAASFEMMLKYIVHADHVEEMRKFVDLYTINERLKGQYSITKQFKTQSGRWDEGSFIAAKRDEAGNCLNIIWAVKDATEDKEKEIAYMEELHKARIKADAANAAKTSFLFNMSHDIRTPMNAIIGFTNLLRKYQDNKDKREDYLGKIEASSTVLLSIINNVLEMARIEKGTIEIDESAWSAEQFNDTLYSIFHEMMKHKGLEFTRTIDVQHNYVMCDPTKLREVFINILSNAYKYTNSGGKVHMLLEEVPSTREGYAFYRTTITDTGIGMSEDFLPHLYDEFSRESNTTENKIEGTGLGMSIVKRLVTMMEGTIEVKSQKGVGTTFVVTIPHKITDRSSLVDHAGVMLDPRLFKDKRILLAEDNDLNAEIAVEILSEVGFVVERAEDGVQCVEMLENAEANYYDIVLMDIQMPRMNGYEAARAIRALSDSAKSIVPILAMTANAFEEDKREALRAGMNGHLSKPVNVQELMKALSLIIS